jgi:ribA/ribD-fused uncharacterized protein
MNRPAITSFSGEYRWLSNFYRCNVILDDIIYPSVEHAYQAAKTLNLRDRELIRRKPTAGMAKRYGKIVVMRPDWNDVRLAIMEDLVRQKFLTSSMERLLLSTGDAELIEGNYWGDTFWGVCRGVGENHLGKILMKIREELKA